MRFLKEALSTCLALDVNVLGFHNYHDSVKNPTALGPIKRKMDNQEYKNACEFAADVRLMFMNHLLRMQSYGS